jgi:deoxyhypusine synthase
LQRLQHIDVSKISDFDEMLRAMENTAFQGANLGKAAEVMFQMAIDPDAFVVLTVSGAMTPAQQMLVITEMIDRGLVHAVVSTGALMTHGFVASAGMRHYRYDPKMTDVALYHSGYNRIYDVLEPEKNLDDVEEIMHEVLSAIPEGTVLSSRAIMHLLGKWLYKNVDGRGILKSAFEKDVAVYVPAFTDSELGLNVAVYNRKQVVLGKPPLDFNPFFDLEHFLEMFNQQKKLGIITVGGGVPRNWAQQAPPYLELIQRRMPKGKTPRHLTPKQYTYALRISTDLPNFGGLSGCTYEEGKSWGKFASNAMYAEVVSDATLVWPILVKAVIQRLEKKNQKIRKSFNLSKQLEKVANYTKRYQLERYGHKLISYAM